MVLHGGGEYLVENSYVGMLDGFGKSLSSAFACTSKELPPLTISFDSER